MTNPNLARANKDHLTHLLSGRFDEQFDVYGKQASAVNKITFVLASDTALTVRYVNGEAMTAILRTAGFDDAVSYELSRSEVTQLPPSVRFSMPSFEVEVHRIAVQTCTVTVRAENEAEAREVALVQAGDCTYQESSAEYEIEAVRETNDA